MEVSGELRTKDDWLNDGPEDLPNRQEEGGVVMDVKRALSSKFLSSSFLLSSRGFRDVSSTNIFQDVKRSLGPVLIPHERHTTTNDLGISLDFDNERDPPRYKFAAKRGEVFRLSEEHGSHVLPRRDDSVVMLDGHKVEDRISFQKAFKQFKMVSARWTQNIKFLVTESSHVPARFHATDRMPRASILPVVEHYKNLRSQGGERFEKCLLFTKVLQPEENVHDWYIGIHKATDCLLVQNDEGNGPDDQMRPSTHSSRPDPLREHDMVIGIGGHPLCSPKDQNGMVSLMDVHPICCTGGHALAFLNNVRNPVAVHFVRFFQHPEDDGGARLVDVVLDNRYGGNLSRYLVTTMTGRDGEEEGKGEEEDDEVVVVGERSEKREKREESERSESTGSGEKLDEDDKRYNLEYIAVHASWHDPEKNTPHLCLVAKRDIEKNEVLVAPPLPKAMLS